MSRGTLYEARCSAAIGDAALADRFDGLDLDPALIARDRSVPLDQVGGFLALRSERAADLVGRLRRRGVLSDSRGDLLRLGPAPYLCDQQLGSAMEALATALRETWKESNGHLE
jgi:kynureninase